MTRTLRNLLLGAALSVPLLATASPATAAPVAPAATEAGATGAQVPAVVKKIEGKYADVKAMKARFTQTVKNPAYGDEVQKGEVTLERPAKMHWNFSGDGKQFVTDGRTMWIYNPGHKQVIRYKDVSSQAGSAQSLLTSLDRIGQLFSITERPDDSGHTLVLVPREADAQYKNVVLHLNGELTVEKVVITDNFDTVTELVFHDIRLDPKVPADQFVFSVPKGVEVIDAGSP